MPMLWLRIEDVTIVTNVSQMKVIKNIPHDKQFINTPDSFSTPIGGERVGVFKRLIMTSVYDRLASACQARKIITRNAIHSY